MSGRAIDNDPRINADANPFAAQSSTEASLLAALDRLAAKLQTYRARSINSSQASVLDALADDIAEERERVRGGGRE
ncbi:hypothetical protein [Dietzia maris]|uniref:hypothetical protein n=1 Tax=Dietzia maris TaxID=37915 RepID=UPI0037C98BAA